MKIIHLSVIALGIVSGTGPSDENQAPQNPGNPSPDAANQGFQIPGYPDLVKDYQNPSRSSSLVIKQDSNGKPIHRLAPFLRVKKRMCYTNGAAGFESWSTLRLVSTVPLLTAGSVKIGDDKAETTFIQLLPESQFIHLPKLAFERIGNIVGLSGDRVMKTPWRFSRDKLKELPNIDLQFSESQALFTIKPEAYTRCATEGDECVLLIKLGSLAKRDFWFLGKPFFDYIVSVFSLGNYKDSFVNVCYPILATDRRETWPILVGKSDTKVGMPWTPNDYVLMVLIALFALGCIWFIFRNKITLCSRRQRASVEPAPAAASSPEEGTNATTDTQPLLNSNNQP